MAFYCSLVKAVNNINFTIKQITIKYLETGHTAMSANSDHQLINRQLKALPKIQDFNDFIVIVKRAGLSTFEMKNEHFMKFCDEISKHKLKKLGNERPFLKDVTVVEVRRGSENLFIKKCFLDESFCEYINDIYNLHTGCGTLKPANLIEG